jgi:hypothetical protein
MTMHTGEEMGNEVHLALHFQHDVTTIINDMIFSHHSARLAKNKEILVLVVLILSKADFLGLALLRIVHR